MKVKKVLSMLLVFVMTVMIVACNNQGAVQEESPAAPEGKPAEIEEAEEPAKKPDKQYVLKHCHVLAATEPFNQGFLNWAKAVDERTNGGLKIEVFPAGQMGVEEDLLEQAKEGVNVGHNTARLGMYVEEIAVMNGPYFVADLDEVLKLKDSPTLQAYIDEVEGYGLKVLSYNWVQTHRQFFTNVEINKPEDLKGLRIRTPGSPIWQESVRALGAEPVAMNFGEMYSGIQQGAVDGAELVYANIPGGKLNEVLSYANETDHILLINFQVCSADWFNSLPEEYQIILVEECDKAGLETSQQMEANVEKIKTDLLAAGMTINEDCDVEAFKAAGESAYEVLGLTEVKAKIWEEIGKK
jgi:TRAP-type C4-dicarboxylate transport system substrate-binding protein